MKVGIVGGTGELGRGLALRFQSGMVVIVGSRSRERAEQCAESLLGKAKADVRGATDEEAASECDVAILAVPEVDEGFMKRLEGPLSGKLAISPIAPMRRVGRYFEHALPRGSAAEEVARVLGRSRVAAALHVVPAEKLQSGASLSYDVPVAADDRRTYEEAALVVKMVDGLRPLYAGPLACARIVESLAPFLINVGMLNGIRSPSIRLVE